MAGVVLKCCAPWRFIKLARFKSMQRLKNQIKTCILNVDKNRGKVMELIRDDTSVRFPSTPSLKFHTAAFPMMGRTVQEFDQAKNMLSTLKQDPGNEVKLKIYALFKQATQGPCNTPKPGMLDFVNKAKWDAWKSLGTISQDEARERYCDVIGSLMAAEGGSTAQVAAEPAGSGPSYDSLLVTTEDDITIIKLNRPAKKNAITTQMYRDIVKALDEAAKDDSVITVFTGAGDFYCSGNDLSNFTKIPEAGIEKMAKDAGDLLRNFVKAYIDFPKPLVAVVNGPAVGVSVTILGLFDLVYATERATFHTPFSQLGQSAEGCSSYTFPKMMGSAKANEMLLFNKKLTAVQACELGLVTEVFPESSFQSEVWTRVKAYAKLPPQSLTLSKQLIRSTEKERLHAVNKAEVELLVKLWTSDECINAIMNFFKAKSKL